MLKNSCGYFFLVFQHQTWILVNLDHRYDIWCHLDTNKNTFWFQISHTQVLSRTLTPFSHLNFEIFWSCFKQSKHDRKQLKMDETCGVYLNFFIKVWEPLIFFLSVCSIPLDLMVGFKFDCYIHPTSKEIFLTNLTSLFKMV